MKKLIYLILIILLCITSFALISCGGEDDTTTTADPDLFNITYELNGGTNNENNPTTYNEGDIVTLSFPTKEDYMFMGWFTDSTFRPQNKIKEIKDIEENLTLYAKWIPLEDFFVLQKEGEEYVIKGSMDTDTIIIPSTYKGLPVTGINEWAFGYLKYTKTVIISDSITNIDPRAFMGSNGYQHADLSIESIIVDSNNPSFKSMDGVLYSKDGKDLIRYPESKVGDSFAVPDGVTVIKQFSFFHCLNLKSVTFPDSLTTIEGWTFEACYSLESITLTKTMESIGGSAFQNCHKLKSITIPGNIKILNAPVSNCNNLESVIIEEGVTTINGIFAGLPSLKSIVIPDSVTVIGTYAFKYTPDLTIYCRAETKPDGWADDWDENVKEVVWGYKEGNK